MGRMNWDRVRRDNRLARSDDYSARMEAAESLLRDPPRHRRAKRLAKSEKLRRDAAAAGISAAELQRRRRQLAKQDPLLKAEARRRGIKSKQLRRMIERGEASMPPPPQPSGRLIVSSGRRNRERAAEDDVRSRSRGQSKAVTERSRGSGRSVGRSAAAPAVSPDRQRTPSKPLPPCAACGAPISVNGRCGCS